MPQRHCAVRAAACSRVRTCMPLYGRGSASTQPSPSTLMRDAGACPPPRVHCGISSYKGDAADTVLYAQQRTVECLRITLCMAEGARAHTEPIHTDVRSGSVSTPPSYKGNAADTVLYAQQHTVECPLHYALYGRGSASTQPSPSTLMRDAGACRYSHHTKEMPQTLCCTLSSVQ